MSFENLLKTLEEKGQAEESAILNTAKSEAKKIQSEASERAKAIIDQAKLDGQKLGNEVKLEISANARLKQKRITSEARESLINSAIQTLENQLREFAETKEYAKLLTALARDCVHSLGKDALLYCRKADEKLLTQAGFKVKNNVKIIGGVIAETPDGKVKVNNSLESLVELNKEKLRQVAFKELPSNTAKEATKDEKVAKKKAGKKGEK